MEGILAMLTVILAIVVENVSGSTGDRSQMFYNCLQSCLAENCSASSPAFHPSLHLKLLQWACPDECKYMCMWPTVNWFVEAGIGVQQFYGKWPFIRVFGVQEPAATLFSIFNLVCHVVMIKKFRKEVNPKAPFYLLTHLFCFVCCHAWFWSTVFHLRDVQFTEIMDYLGAFSMVTFSVYHFFVRITALNSNSSLYSLFFATAIGFYFVYHSYTTFFVKMDYGYNMLINIAFGKLKVLVYTYEGLTMGLNFSFDAMQLIGAINIIGWSTWCFKYYRRRPYVKRCATFTALVGVTTLLEVMDFPPLFWVLDAHALWHLTTSPLVILWYRFLIDDCHYLEGEMVDYEKLA